MTTPTGGQGSAPSSRTLFFQVYPSIVLPMFLAAIDNTIVATALPDIAASLGDVERVSWVVVSYLMATTIAAAVYGRLGDAMGRRKLLLVSLAVFIAASGLCAAAPTMLTLVAARVLQGIGGGGLMTLCQALVGEVVPPRERGRIQGYMAGVYMMASAFGPVAGGWLTQHFGWTSVFLVNLPLGLLAMALATRLKTRPGAGGPLRFDWPGLAFFAGFVVALLLALELAQRLSATAVPGILLWAALSVVSLVLLLRQERRAAAPLIPVKLLRHAAIWRADAMGACVGAIIISTVTFMPIYLQVARGIPPGQVGLLMLPLTAGIALGAMFTGRMITVTGRTAIFPSIGQVLVTACLLTLGLNAGSLSMSVLPWLFLLLAVSLGTTMPVVNVTVQSAAGPQNLGAAAASVQFTRSIGGALGTATVGAVLFATLALRDPATAGLFADIVERGPTVLAALTAPAQAALAVEITAAFRAAFLTVASFSVLATILAWTLPLRRF